MSEGYATIDEILNDILKTLSKEEKEKIKKMSAIEFEVQEHFNLGMWIRNKYFYQNKKQDILIDNLKGKDEFLFIDGDEFTGIIMEKLYKRIKEV